MQSFVVFVGISLEFLLNQRNEGNRLSRNQYNYASITPSSTFFFHRAFMREVIQSCAIIGDLRSRCLTTKEEKRE